ncbi:hypothetical protein [Methanococcoides burtonii]|uniref:hypothetical protein n=1 Tax=Methanococcoides burtonii TaxID=29291 RepID=UPI0018DB482D|nr:hypothetical protein [Methanococcoides burtonii]
MITMEHERIKLTYVTDATILIVMCEIAVGMYAREFDHNFIFALSALILVLGIVRVLAIKHSPEHESGSFKFPNVSVIKDVSGSEE